MSLWFKSQGMKMNLVTWLLVGVLSALSHPAFAQKSGESSKPSASRKSGSGSSGGGDERGIGISLTLKQLARRITQMGDAVTTADKRSEIESIASQAEILIVNEDLPAEKPVDLNRDQIKVQIGLAYSQWIKNDQGELVPLIQINAYRLKNEKDEERKNLTLVHELFVLAGLEKTGQYTYTNRYHDQLSTNWKMVAENRSQGVCTITAFQKGLNNPAYGEYVNWASRDQIGDTLGQATLTINHVGASGVAGKIFIINKKRAVSVSGVMDSAGYFRAEIGEAQSEWPYVIEKVLVKSKVYYSPYAEKEEVSNTPTFVAAGNVWFLISCAWM